MTKIKILFVRSNKANLPEIEAYIRYFSRNELFQVFDSSNLKNIDYEKYDVIWEFKGFGGYKKRKNQILIHEYASLSTGFLRNIKDLIKAKFNQKPSIRIFLNEIVKERFGFKDKVPSFYRDMGVEEIFFDFRDSIKEYDFVYVGAISRSRSIETMLDKFVQVQPGTMCLIGSYDPEIYSRFAKYSFLTFTGKVPYSKVPEIASKARYGLNYIPNRMPFNIQTSTKLLEYLAMGLKVITTDYEWVNSFEKESGYRFFRFSDSEINREELNKFDFVQGFDVSHFRWERILNNSGIETVILNMYYEIKKDINDDER